MSESGTPAEQLRALPTDELVSRVLEAANLDDTSRWDAVAALHWRGTIDVFEAAAGMCRSPSPNVQASGLDILAQLGIPDRTFQPEAKALIRGFLTPETPEAPLNSAICAVGHQADDEAVPLLAPLAKHDSPDIRFDVACALGSLHGSVAVETLIALMSDEDSDVRDWATFGLGTQHEEDSDDIRRALWSRVHDEDAETRAEAIGGLAARGIREVVPELAAALQSVVDGEIDDYLRLTDAADALQDPTLVPLLRALGRVPEWVTIDRFVDENAFLSNFWPSAIRYPEDDPEAPEYPTVEHVFQAIKTNDPVERETVRLAPTPGKAKRLGLRVQMRPDWPQVRVGIMTDLLRQKFAKEPLRSQLLATDQAQLIEGNDWHDQLWGHCTCAKHASTPGENLLGRALMEVRKELAVQTDG